MSAAGPNRTPGPRWPIVVPSAGIVVLAGSLFWPVVGALAAACGIALVGAVIAAVHHAEVVAHRIGEPFGTLVLAIAVTIIEASLIISLLLAGGEHTEVLVRDTVYATVMIIATGVIGLCILLGSIRHREQQFKIEGAGPAFAALAALAVLVLIMPVFTVSAPGALYTTSQLAFVAVCSLLLWCVFVFFQTVSHRDYFLPLPAAPAAAVGSHAPAPSNARALSSLGLLCVSLTAVVVLAKQLSPSIEAAVAAVNAPRAAVGIAVAVLVLLPESLAAGRAALVNRMQTSLNLALGSALATIGLTIPVVVIVCIAFDIPMVLGLAAKDIVLLTLTLLVGAIGIGSGRTNLMYGAVQIVIFAAFLFLALVP
jgi:Ca2+:H+ antiporter